MKLKLIIACLCLSFNANAQWANVRFWLHEPVTHEFRVSGIPTNWPSAMMPTNAPSQLSGWQLMTMEEFHDYKAARKAGYDAWVTSRNDSVVQVRDAKLQAVADIFDRLALAQNNWNTLTQAQITQVVSNQNLLFLQLRPLLRELYANKEQ